MIDRRSFLLSGVVTVLAGPLAAEEQQAARTYRIGFLSSSASTPPRGPNWNALVQGFGRLGYVEGQNLVIEVRSASGRAERLPELAAELIRLNVDVIVAAGSTATGAAKNATVTTPIVMVGSGDPVRLGFVANLGRPGGNITGLSSDVTAETWSKRLQLLTEVAPRASRVALLLEYRRSSPSARPGSRRHRIPSSTPGETGV